jgi:hypothetical protein
MERLMRLILASDAVFELLVNPAATFGHDRPER